MLLLQEASVFSQSCLECSHECFILPHLIPGAKGLMDFAQWLFGEFIPFGDLVSDVALVLTLPIADDTADASLDRFMRWLLWVGTLLSSVPEIALFVGIATGLVVGATLGPATFSTGGKGMDELSANGRATVAILR